jgi:hypothetical protein
MSNMTLTWIIVGFFILFIVVGGIVMAWIKHAQYMKEVQGKIKCVFFPETGSTYSKVVDVDLSGHSIDAPKGHHLPRYFFNKENTWNTRYPENPIFGLTAICVQIATVWYYEDNPEPITSHPSTPVATASMIFASIDRAFALVVNELDEELQKTKKALLEALQTKLSKVIVYGGLILIFVAVLVDIYFGYANSQKMADLSKMFGIK